MLIECFNIESHQGSLDSDYFLNHPVIKKLLGRGPECKCGVRLGNSLTDDGRWLVLLWCECTWGEVFRFGVYLELEPIGLGVGK